MGWTIRDSQNKPVFVAQSLDPKEEKEHCEVVCAAINNAFKYLIKEEQ